MNCRWQDIPNTLDGNGWRCVRCVRCGFETKPTPHGYERIFHECSAWPLATEHREWLALFAAAVGIVGAVHYLQYLRWRLRGSRIDDLPAGIPRPVIAPLPAPAFGPGTELEKLLEAAGAKPDCQRGCKAFRDQMNLWGIVGCRTKRAEIINRLSSAAFSSWVADQLRIGWHIRKEGWFKLTDPLGSIVDEAIRRAEATRSIADETRPHP